MKKKNKYLENNASVIITSVPFNDKKCCVGFDSKKGESFRIEYDEIDVRFPGTGDIFSAILVGDILNGKSLPDATSHSMEVVKKMIELNIDKADKYRGIPVEQYLELI